MKTDTIDIDRMPEQSQEAAEAILNSVFGTGPTPPEPAEETEEETAGEAEEVEETGEAETSEEETTDDSEHDDKDSDKDKEEEGEDEPEDYTDLFEPVRDLLPEDAGLKSREDVGKAITAIKDRYSEARTMLDEELEANKDLISVFGRAPEVAKITKSLLKDPELTFRQAVYQVLGTEQAVPDKKTNPEAYADYILAKKQQATEAESRKKEAEDNIKQSEEVIQSFAKNTGLKKDETDKIMQTAHGFLKDLGRGVVSKDFLEVMRKGLNFDAEIKKTAEKAKVEGKNEAASTNKKRKKGDGLPKPKRAAGGGKPAPDISKSVVGQTIARASDKFAW